MKVIELKKWLEDIPDDLEVKWRYFEGFAVLELVVVQGEIVHRSDDIFETEAE